MQYLAILLSFVLKKTKWVFVLRKDRISKGRRILEIACVPESTLGESLWGADCGFAIETGGPCKINTRAVTSAMTWGIYETLTENQQRLFWGNVKDWLKNHKPDGKPEPTATPTQAPTPPGVSFEFESL